MIALYLVLMVVSRIGVAMLPTDLEGAKRTPTGIGHYVFAIANFTLVYLVIDKTTDFLVLDPHLASSHPIWPMLKWIVAVALAGIVLTMFRPLRSNLGLVVTCLYRFVHELVYAGVHLRFSPVEWSIAKFAQSRALEMTLF